MSSVNDEASSQASSADEGGTEFTDVKSEGCPPKVNGLSEESVSDGGGGGDKPKVNGISHEKSSHKHRDDRHKSSSDKSKSSSSSSSKHGSSSSSSKHKDGSSSSKHSSSSSSSKHRDGSSSKHSSSSSSSKSKDGSSSSSSHRDGKSSSSSSSSSKHKDGSSSKHSSSSSSSSSKHKDGSSSSSSKHRSESKDGSSSSNKDKDRHRDKSKESSSSSSKDKDRHKSSSSSSGDKHKSSSSSDKHKSSSGDKHKSSSSSDKHRSSSSGDKHKSSKDSSKKEAEAVVKVKEEADVDIEEMNHNNHRESPVKVKEEAVSSPVKKEPSPVKKEKVQSPVKKEVTPEKAPVKYDEEEEEDSEDEDKPLSLRINESRPSKRPKEESDYEENGEEEEEDDDDEDDVPLSARAKQVKKVKKEKSVSPPPKKVKKEAPAVKKGKAAKKRKGDPEEQTATPTKKKKGEEESQEVWRWWEEQSEDQGVKWTFLEHMGPRFAPPYEPMPKNVRFYYDGKPMQLTMDTEEVATFYGRMLDHDYTTRDVFNNNFMKDWRKVMTPEEKAIITDIKKCNFTEYNDHFKKKSEERKAMSKEEKQAIKKENEEIAKEYGFCIIDHHKEKIGNFKIEPPSLFRGRGDHPKQGMLKRRVEPKDVIINCSKDSKIPSPPEGTKWKEVRHDNTVTWLASWTENIQGATKYVMLNAASKLKGQKDWQKYETARSLHKCVDKIRQNYQEDWKSKEMRVRQRSVALYFIDKLALRAGNEKDDESADTVGCCSLRVEHITLHAQKDDKSNVVEFDFLGKDSIRYQNSIPVEKRVFKNLQLFVENKAPQDDLFDRLNTTILNKHLQDLMPGLTAKVFRTYNASRTLSEQLQILTDPNDAVAAKILSYNRANRAVAILCNHQRAVPKTFEKSMENLQKKIDAKNDDIKVVKKDIKAIKAEYKQQKSVKTKTLYEKKKKTLARLEDQLTKLEVQATDKDENKEIALGTSKLNYLDPRISVAWCKKFEVPIEKVYNKTQRDKFRWAIDMATEHFRF